MYVYTHREICGIFLFPTQPPDRLIALYNSILTYLADTASSDQLHSVSWPVMEFAPRQFGISLAPDHFNNEGTLKYQYTSCVLIK